MTHNENPENLAARIAALQESLDARTFELDVLHALSQKIGHTLNYEELFRAILTHLEKAVACDVAAGLLIAEETRELYLRRLRPLAVSVHQEVERRLLDAYARMTGQAVARRAIATRVVETDDPPQTELPLERLAGFFQVPILSQGRTLGFILVGSESADWFTEDHIRLLCTVANQASGAVERLQSLLAQERRRLQAVVENVPDGLVLLDGQRRITMTNPAGAAALRRLGGARVGEVLRRLNGHSFAEILARSAACGVEDLSLKGPPAQILEPTIIPLDAAPLPERWLLVLRDVTESRKAIQQRDRFLAMLAHELRNPLAAISGANILLGKSGLKPEVQQQALNVVAGQTTHLVRLVDDLLDVSRVLHDKITLQKQPLDLARLMTDTVEAYRPSIEAGGQELTVSSCDEALWVEGDRVRLAQVLTNLIANAARYSPPGGRISVRCGREGANAVVRIRDTGIGIEPDRLKEIFEPFLQLNDSLERSEGGLGLGLALVHALVARHGGNVSAHSDGPGTGSEFVVCLPAVAAAEPVETAVDEIPHRTRRRILIVEDNHDACLMLSKILEASGHTVECAATGPEGVERYGRLHPDVVLLDIGLPGMDGYQVARAIRAIEDGQAACLVALTGYGQPEDRRRTREAGFDAHFVKPVDIGELNRLLQELP